MEKKATLMSEKRECQAGRCGVGDALGVLRSQRLRRYGNMGKEETAGRLKTWRLCGGSLERDDH